MVRLRSILATLRPRMTPSVNSSFAVPFKAETISGRLSPLVVRSTSIAPLPSMLWNSTAS